ncbi:MAG: hypothetical protein QMD17_13840 [Rhodocyclaceae bacterium]|nr:hypothetical protein [Rhodocyclaceae bacterium]
MYRKTGMTTLLLAALSCGNTWATQPDEISSLSVRGFGTLGVARSSSDHAEFARDFSQPKGIKGGQWSGRIDSILGLQANWQATSQLELVGQLVSRYRYDESRDPEVMWAFAKWEPDARVALRAGRIGADFMMLADSRLVGYSSLTVRPPTDFFGPLFFSHFDGADASLTWPLGKGLVRGKLFGGTISEKTPLAIELWDTSGASTRGLVLDYLTGPWQLRASMAYVDYSNDIQYTRRLADLLRGTAVPSASIAADALKVAGTTTRYDTLGVVYDAGPLQVQAMLNSIRHEAGYLHNSHAGYLLAGYRLGAVTPYAGVSWWKSRLKSPSTGLPNPAFADLNREFDFAMGTTVADQTTYTLGARWSLCRNTAIKLQWDAIRGSASSRLPVLRSQPDWNGRTDVISAVVDFIF